MISVIISSVNKAMLAAVSQNIADTIGVPFEIIGLDNSAGERGLCAVYNEGASRASYAILCFMHEDISIKTSNWGNIILELFIQNTDIGLVGVAGNAYKPLTPSGCMTFATDKTGYVNLSQGFKYSNKQPQKMYHNPRNNHFEKVACLDGVWFCTTSNVFSKVQFDDKLLTGFHGYDIDFSLAVGQHYKVVVTFDILMHHFSEGRFEDDWFFTMLKVNEKWSRFLPVATEAMSQKEKLNIERIVFKTFVEYLIRAKHPASEAYKVLRRDNRYFRLSPTLFFKLHNFVRKAFRVAKQEGRL